MAVNDKESTRRMREAATYFSDMEKQFENRGTEEMEINDGKVGSMLKEASYAASIFAEDCRL